MNRAITVQTRPRRDAREPVATLLDRVTYDRDASTPWHEVYPAKSDTTDHTYRVVYDVLAAAWDCEEERCLGFRHHRHCRHIDRAKRLRALRWFKALYLGWGPTDLRRQRQHYRDLAREGLTLGEDDLAALDAISLLLGEREEEAA